MFDNIGSKIKTLATVIAWTGIIASLLTGFVLMAEDAGAAFIGLLIMVIGSLMSWVGSFMTYGFGHLIENTDKLVAKQKDTTPSLVNKTSTQNPPQTMKEEIADKINTLNSWKEQGLITDEEYNKKVNELKGDK